MNDVNKNLGHATAYGYAKSKGYTGTEDEFAALMADYAAVGERAEAAATAAAASATAASGSASDSAASATAAAGSSTAASTAAGNASQAAQTATTKASEAAQSATAAAGSATTASTKAGEAAQSATQAAGSATAAESAKTAAQTAQTAAETAQTAAETAQTAAEDAAESVSASAAQIAQNTADISSVKNALGQWYFSRQWTNEQYPYVLVNDFSGRVFYKLVEPTEHVTGFLVFGSNDGWQTQTSIYSQSLALNGSEYYVDIPSGYTSLKFALTMDQAYTGTYAAIIHSIDNHSISQYVLDLVNDVNSLETSLAESVYSIGDVMTGTNYNGFYINSAPYHGIQSISNTVFNVRKYPVTKGNVYFLSGIGVALAANLPVAAFGVEDVVDENNYIEKILDGSTTPTDYFEKYVPDQNGYIYVAWITNNVELKLYNGVLAADVVNDIIQDMPDKRNIKIQLFGDSITDNTWGDLQTWANYIPQYLSDVLTPTVVNSAVGGSPLTHSNANNGVWDLVCSADYSVLDNNADVIVILSGTNDWAGVVASTGDNIGAWGGNYYTIYGALQQIIEKISEETSAKIIVCTPPQRYNSVDRDRPTDSRGTPLNYNGKTLRDFCDAMLDVSQYYGIMCLDLNAILGWDRKNVGDFTTDGLHPNTVGDEWVGRLICNEIKRHMTP